MPRAAPTLFARLRRYRPRPGRDAFEDRLTEALAATLEAAPDAACALVRQWFAEAELAGHTLVVTTQHWATVRERIDLELAFGPPGRPVFRLWLEAKVSATPTRSQAERYLAALPARSRLSWVLPVGVTVVGGSPGGVPEHTWQELATVLHQWEDSLPPEHQSAFGPRLVREFVHHLEEVKLAAVRPFDELDVSAINGVEVATARIRES